MFDSLRCHGVSECLFSVVLYAPIKLHAQRVATNVIGTLATGKKYKKKGKKRGNRARERERERERELSRGKNSAICTVDPFIPQIRIGFTF